MQSGGLGFWAGNLRGAKRSAWGRGKLLSIRWIPPEAKAVRQDPDYVPGHMNNVVTHQSQKVPISKSYPLFSDPR
jgi:hypothetical protein